MTFQCVAERMHEGKYCVVVNASCRVCHGVTTLNVPESEWLRWQSGALIQDAIPSLSAAERELLISGTCGACFDAIFKESDDACDEEDFEDVNQGDFEDEEDDERPY